MSRQVAKKSVVILGAGVVGLSTAVNVQNYYPDLEVTIIADKFDVDTTSDGAAGIFRPSSKKTSGDAAIIRYVKFVTNACFLCRKCVSSFKTRHKMSDTFNFRFSNGG